MNSHLFIIVFTFCALRIKADEIILPSSFANQNADSAGSLAQFDGIRLQQIYSKSLFETVPSDNIEISAIRFRIDPDAPAINTTVEMQVRLFTTGDMPDTVRDRLFSESNAAIALPRTTVAWSGNPGLSFDVQVPLPNAYLYNRTSGNLVVDFSIFSAGQQRTDFDATSSISDGTSVVQGTINGLPFVQSGTGGFVTTFSYTPVVVPEPSVVALLVCAWFVYLGESRRVRSARNI